MLPPIKEYGIVFYFGESLTFFGLWVVPRTLSMVLSYIP